MTCKSARTSWSVRIATATSQGIIFFFYLSALMGLMEKRRFRNFLIFVNEYNKDDPKTYKGILVVLVLVYK